MIERRQLIVKGDVQGVGYRMIVKDAAAKLKIMGFVQNLKDGTVKIICEGKKKALERFVKAVNIQKKRIYVDQIVSKPGKVTREFNRFRILRGHLSEGELEIMERLDSGLELTEEMHSDLSKGQTEIADTEKEAISSIKTMNTEMGQCFKGLDDKYGEFGKGMEDISKDLKEMKELFAKLVEHYINQSSQKT